MVAAMMRDFAPPESLAYWSLAAMSDLRNSILSDMEAKRFFAWQTRLRQVEEIYMRALYCLFIADPDELPHVISGAVPNSVTPMHRKVNALVFEGRGEWEASKDGASIGKYTPLGILHSSAHASYAAMRTAIACSRHDESAFDYEGYKRHLVTYCDRLEYMHRMFKGGKDKQTVLEAMVSLHRPASYWTAQGAGNEPTD